MKFTRVLIIGTVVFLLLTGAALAMSSANYRMDWFLALSGAGGGAAASSGYQVNLTSAQFVVGPATSANYGTQLGYWAGVLAEYHVYLPLVLRG